MLSQNLMQTLASYREGLLEVGSDRPKIFFVSFLGMLSTAGHQTLP